ncbi:Lysosomal alpha-mannosidase [Gryllus bimaculatus]|nr:Lysosomal alpha-mannosidase [Gryllus bimaculatus]
MVEKETSTVPLWETCLHLNESRCSPTEESENFVVTVYNPLAHAISSYVRIPVSGDYYYVQDSAGDNVVNQVVPIPDSVLKIPGRVSPAVNELIFPAEFLQPLGFHSYFISEKRFKEESTTHKSKVTKSFGTFGHENHHYKGNRFGDLRSLSTQGVNFRAEISYHFYETSGISPHFHNADGGYIFRPNSAKPKTVPPRSSFRTYKGK